jgi:hydroxyacylglutathione hydrolase
MLEFFSYDFGDHTVLQTPTLWDTYRGYNYMIAHKGEAYVFDPGEFAPIENTLQKNNLRLEGIYLTHHHADHVDGTEALRQKYQCPVYGLVQEAKRLPPLDYPFHAGEILAIADLPAKVAFLPGHTLGLCAFYFMEQNWLFSNDLLFSLGCGRIFEGTAKQMHHSLSKVLELPDDTLIFPSHEYTLSNLEFGLAMLPEDQALQEIADTIQVKSKKQTPTVPTTLAFEKKYNPFLRVDDPAIKEALNMPEARGWEVFAKLRELKDNF